MEEKKRLYEIIKLLSEENAELYKKIKEMEVRKKLQSNDNEELVECDNCGEKVPGDYLSNNDFITEGGNLNICLQCVENGYGE